MFLIRLFRFSNDTGYTRYALRMANIMVEITRSPQFSTESWMHGLKGNWTPYGGMQIAEDLSGLQPLVLVKI